MILSNYYQFIKGSGKTRFDCTQSTRDFETFETLRNKAGDLFLHLTGTEANYIKANSQRKADFKLSKTKHLSSLFFPNLDTPVLAYEDIIENQSALIFIFNTELTTFELFVAKGYRSHKSALCNAVTAGELNSEMDLLRNKAKPEGSIVIAA